MEYPDDGEIAREPRKGSSPTRRCCEETESELWWWEDAGSGEGAGLEGVVKARDSGGLSSLSCSSKELRMVSSKERPSESAGNAKPMSARQEVDRRGRYTHHSFSMTHATP